MQEQFDLDKKIRAIIRREWNAGNPRIESESIYEELVGAGVIVPPDMMNSILDSLQKQFLIDGKKWIDASAVTQHGDMSITRVSDRLK